MAAMVLKMKSNSQGSHLPSSLCACALPCRFCHSASISWPSWSTACAKHDSERGDWHPPRTHQWPIHHRQLTSNSLTTPSTAPAANRWMDSLSPVRPPQLWPPYEPGGAIQKASKCRMLGIVKLGTFNQFSGCGYGALTGPLWICASATAWATMLRSNSWAASNQSQRQVPSNGRPFWKVPVRNVRNQKPVLRQGLRQSCGTFNSTCSLLLGSPRLSETIRNNICWA